MRRRIAETADQLGFASLLADADAANQAHAFERATRHLPATMDAALPYYLALIERHHAAMLAAEVATVMQLREEAYNLARKLNRGAPGIVADAQAPGCVLTRAAAAPEGTVPLWGQAGAFVITVARMRVRIEMDGLFGIGGRHLLWPGFAAHAVNRDRPFLSETGYRSFLGVPGPALTGLTPDGFARAIVTAYVKDVLKGKLLRIEKRTPA